MKIYIHLKQQNYFIKTIIESNDISKRDLLSVY